jgi:uncharacterized membrane protein YccC
MQYIIQILCAILIGTAVGAVLGPRNKVLLIGSVGGIVMGFIAMFTANWMILVAGTAMFLVAQGMQRDPGVRRV